MNDQITLIEIASALEISHRGALKRSIKESWPFVEVKGLGRGGKMKTFSYSQLPEDVQMALGIWRAREALKAEEAREAAKKSLVPTGGNVPVGTGPNGQEDGRAVAVRQGEVGYERREVVTATGRWNPVGYRVETAEGFYGEEVMRATMASSLVMHYRAHYQRFPKRKNRGAAKKRFIEEYNKGERGSYPELHKHLGHIGYSTIERWDLALERSENDFHMLLDARGKHRKGLKSLSPDHLDRLVATALSPNAPLISETIRSFKKTIKDDGSECTLSNDTLRRYINEFKMNNYASWVFYREGEKSLNDKCIVHVERDYERIEVGDIAVADGHKLNFDILNPWTGRAHRMVIILWYDMKSNYVMGWEIMPTENTQAISTALYRSILCLGKVPKVAYLDNGKAFKSQYFTRIGRFEDSELPGLYGRLGMETIFARVRHGESKTVERHFGVFAELERRCLSYTGTCIETKPARLKRGEKLHKAIHEILTKGRAPTIEETHRAIANWLDEEYHERPQSGHLGDKCPREEFEAGKGPGLSADDVEKLRILMSNFELKKISRDGIKFPWCEERYYHPDLFAYQNQKAVIRYDWLDKERIWVYRPDGTLICEAVRWRKVHPAARVLGTEQDVHELQEQLQVQKRLEKQVKGPARAFIEAHVIPEVRRQQEAAGFDAARATHSDGLRVVEKQAVEVEAPAMTEDEKARVEREFEQMVAMKHQEEELAKASGIEQIIEIIPRESSQEAEIIEKLPNMSNMDRMEALIELLCKGVDLPVSELTWMTYYRKTPEYSKYKLYFDEYEIKMAMLYQSGGDGTTQEGEEEQSS